MWATFLDRLTSIGFCAFLPKTWLRIATHEGEIFIWNMWSRDHGDIWLYWFAGASAVMIWNLWTAWLQSRTGQNNNWNYVFWTWLFSLILQNLEIKGDWRKFDLISYYGMKEERKWNRDTRKRNKRTAKKWGGRKGRETGNKGSYPMFCVTYRCCFLAEKKSLSLKVLSILSPTFGSV